MNQNEFLEIIANKLSEIKTVDRAYSCDRYNILDVLGVESKESVVCRFLADLLSPDGKHGCGILFLKQFMNRLGSKYQNYSDELLQKASVVTEYIIENERRIDIVIHSSVFFIPIEVKIYAEEQKEQSYAYYKYVKQNYGENTLIYLTRYGTFPSEFSTAGDEETIAHIHCISFADDIRCMLEVCLPEIYDPLVKAMVEAFLDTIKKHSDPLWKKEDEIFKNIYANKDCFRAAIEFEKHLDQLKKRKITIMNDLMTKLEKRVSVLCNEFFNSKIDNRKNASENEHHYYTKCLETFYDTKESTYPGFAYSIKTKKKVDFEGRTLDIRFRVEINYNLFVGICIFDTTNNEEFVLKAHNISSLLEKYINGATKNNSYWAVWEYLPNGSQDISDEVPNFKYMNEAAIRLFDKEEMDIFVENCVPVIKKFLEKTVNLNEIGYEK